MNRSSGILLHLTSLPNEYGIGDLGNTAKQFVDFLVASKQSLWQILPIGPTGYGDSPYQSLSSFAGNYLLISPELLYKEGYLTQDELEECRLPAGDVDYAAVIETKKKMIMAAMKSFPVLKADEFADFCDENKSWLDDFALFAALKDYFDGKSWVEWPKDIADREAAAVQDWTIALEEEIVTQKVAQFIFFSQWNNLKKYANSKGIQIIGDIPIFVAHDSADVWLDRKSYLLNPNGSPSSVAGVPPSRFSSTGQKWGNVLYDWRVVKANKYKLWIDKLQHQLKMVNWLRIDHFRGFVHYWDVPATAATAERGCWVSAPGYEMFEVIKEKLGHVNIIAEDLGYITWDVNCLKEKIGAPGMAILQFAFSGYKRECHGVIESASDDRFKPHNLSRQTVVYTGTHDNDTVVSWWKSARLEEQARVEEYVGHSITDDQIHIEMMRMGMSSVANWSIFPLQDILGLDTKSRMNIPGQPSGNWKWRVPDFNENEIVMTLSKMTKTYGRSNPQI